MIARSSAAVDPEADWRDQIRRAVHAYVADIEARPAVTLSWIREAPALGAACAYRCSAGPWQELIDMFIDLSTNPGFRAPGIAPITQQMAPILFGGLRELTALIVEDGARRPGHRRYRAVAGSTAILGAGRAG